jgi:hypothetical protein
LKACNWLMLLLQKNNLLARMHALVLRALL